MKGYVETRALKLIEENLKAKGMGGVFMDYFELTKPKLTLLVHSLCDAILTEAYRIRQNACTGFWGLE